MISMQYLGDLTNVLNWYLDNELGQVEAKRLNIARNAKPQKGWLPKWENPQWWEKEAANLLKETLKTYTALQQKQHPASTAEKPAPDEAESTTVPTALTDIVTRVEQLIRRINRSYGKHSRLACLLHDLNGTYGFVDITDASLAPTPPDTRPIPRALIQRDRNMVAAETILQHTIVNGLLQTLRTQKTSPCSAQHFFKAAEQRKVGEITQFLEALLNSHAGSYADSVAEEGSFVKLMLNQLSSIARQGLLKPKHWAEKEFTTAIKAAKAYLKQFLPQAPALELSPDESGMEMHGHGHS